MAGSGVLVADRAVRAEDPQGPARDLARALSVDRADRPAVLPQPHHARAARRRARARGHARPFHARAKQQERALEILQFKLDILWAMHDAMEKAYPTTMKRITDARSPPQLDAAVPPAMGAGAGRARAALSRRHGEAERERRRDPEALRRHARRAARSSPTSSRRSTPPASTPTCARSSPARNRRGWLE